MTSNGSPWGRAGTFGTPHAPTATTSTLFFIQQLLKSQLLPQIKLKGRLLEWSVEVRSNGLDAS